MPRLILMRHAKSSWDDPALDDHDRPLNDRGRRSARALGDWLRGKGYLPDQVLCSSARRTQDTLAGLGLDGAHADFLPALYHAEAHTLLSVLQGAAGQTVLLVGHNPGIAAFASAIVRQAPDHNQFLRYPTGATLVGDFGDTPWADVHWRGARAADFIVPRELTD